MLGNRRNRRFNSAQINTERDIPEQLEGVPNIHVVATSRVPLGVPGENLIRLGPLALEDAVSLLEIRVGQRLVRRFAVQIVSRVDRLPLGVELVASTTLLWGAERVATDPAFGARPSLDDVLEWSWNQLTPEEQLVLSVCASFRGTFCHDTVGRVVGRLSSDTSTRGVLEVLRSKSLVGETAGRGSILHIVAEFVRARRTEFEMIRHVRNEVLCEEFPLVHSFERARRVRVERDNLLGAIESASSGEEALHLALVVDEAVSVWGPIRPQCSLLGQLIDKAPASELTSRARLARSRHLRVLRQIPEALGEIDQALATCEPDQKGGLLLSRAACLHEAGESTAWKAYAHAAQALEKSGDISLATVAKVSVAMLGPGDRILALAHVLDATEHASVPRCVALQAMAEALSLDGHHSRAREHLAEMHDAALVLEHTRLEARALLDIGTLRFIISGDGEDQMRAALGLFAETGYVSAEARATVRLALISDDPEAWLTRTNELLEPTDTLWELVDALLVLRGEAPRQHSDSAALNRACPAVVSAAIRVARAVQSGESQSLEPIRQLHAFRAGDWLEMLLLRKARETIRSFVGLGSADDIAFVTRGGRRWNESAIRSLPARRVLETLVTAHLQASSPLCADAMIEAVWPGPKPTGTSGKNRLYVAINTLRKAGVPVQRSSGGYQLDPRVTVVVAMD